MKRIAVVTGASAGLGREFARQLAALDAIDEIWLIARRADELERTAADLGATRGVVFPLDLCQPQAHRELASKLAAEPLRVTWLVNNAGFGDLGPFGADRLDRLLRMVDLNCRALTAVAGVVEPYLAEGSCVVNVGSSAGFLPLPAMAVYGATKAYVESLSHALAAEWHDRGIRVTCVCPGPVRTQFQEVAAIPDPLAPDLLMADPADVVARAIEDARRGRPTSIYGMTVRIYGWMAQILPRNAVPRLGHLVFRKIPGRSRVPADN